MYLIAVLTPAQCGKAWALGQLTRLGHGEERWGQDPELCSPDLVPSDCCYPSSRPGKLQQSQETMCYCWLGRCPRSSLMCIWEHLWYLVSGMTEKGHSYASGCQRCGSSFLTSIYCHSENLMDSLLNQEIFTTRSCARHMTFANAMFGPCHKAWSNLLSFLYSGSSVKLEGPKKKKKNNV